MNNEEKILQMLASMQADITGIKQDVSGLKQDVSELKQDVDILKTQQRENTDIIKAIRHNQEHICAEINALKTHTASAESVTKIRASINALNERIFMQDTNIQELKLVK